MIYVLVFMQFLNTDNLRFYQIATFADFEECQKEKKKANVMIVHSSQKISCLEITATQQ